MHWRMQFWTDMYTAAIACHILNGGDFDTHSYLTKDLQRRLTLTRWDVMREDNDDHRFLSYETCTEDGLSITMMVFQDPKGGGMTYAFTKAARGDVAVDISTEEAVDVAASCFETFIGYMESIWFE